MTFNWSCADDEILIDFVRVHEPLYNVKHKDYRKTMIKQKLWDEVGDILNKTGSDCYRRWGYVRDYYIRRKGKPGFKSSREASKKRSDLLSFLDTFTSTQRNSTTNVGKDESSEENIQEGSFEHDYSPHQETTHEDTSAGHNKTEDSEESDQSDEEKEYKSTNIVRNQKRKNNSHVQERLNLLEQNFQKNPPTQNELDENDLFFSSMAKIVKRLPRYEQAQLRMQIGSLVGNAELRFIPSDSQKPNTSASNYSDITTSTPKPTTASTPTDFLEINIASPSLNDTATNYSETANPSRKLKVNYNK